MITLSMQSYSSSLSYCHITEDVDTITCNMTLSLIKQQLTDLASQFHDIENQHVQNSKNKRSIRDYDFIKIPLNNKRNKRGILDGVSYPINWLFGIPDADDAKFYQSSIEDLINDQKQTHVLMQAQIRVISDTIRNMNKTILNLDQVEEKLNENFFKFNIFMNNSQSIINKNSVQLEVINHLMLIKQLNDMIQRELDRYSDSLSLARHGIIDYKILPPGTLLKELQNSIKFQLPLEPSWQNLEAYYKMMILKSFVSTDKFVIIIKIPITTMDIFSLYKLYPLPTPNSVNPELLSFIKPNFEYLVISKSRSQYALLKTLDHCKQFLNNEYLCSEISTSFQHTKDNCEAILFDVTTRSIPSICEKQTIHAKTEIWQNINQNKWLFVTSADTRCTILCSNQEGSTIILNRIGILELKENCKAFTNTIILEAQTILKNQTFRDYVPEINIQEDDCCKKHGFNRTMLANMQLSPIKLSNLDLNDLKYAQHRLTQFDEQLQQQLNKPFFIRYESSILQYIWIFIYSLLSLGTLYFLYRFKIFFRSWNSIKPMAQECGNFFVNCCSRNKNQMPAAPIFYDVQDEKVKIANSRRKSYQSSNNKRHQSSTKFTPNQI